MCAAHTHKTAVAMMVSAVPSGLSSGAGANTGEDSGAGADNGADSGARDSGVVAMMAEDSGMAMTARFQKKKKMFR